MRSHRWGLFLAAAITLSAMSIAACAPDPMPAPGDGYRADRCAYSAQIEAAFAGTGSEHWAVDVAIRESGCDPCAYYPGRSDCSGIFPGSARGMFQLLGHPDIEAAACDGGTWWVPDCGIRAARLLYDGSGRRPWGG